MKSRIEFLTYALALALPLAAATAGTAAAQPWYFSGQAPGDEPLVARGEGPGAADPVLRIAQRSGFRPWDRAALEPAAPAAAVKRDC